jgi:TetR/AcrR family transcriptional regulator, transcriptional repressor for nem operon
MFIAMKQRRKQPIQTRQAILAAAGSEFAVHGYAGTGLGTIVSNAGLTKGALFHHFPDKQSLAAAWIAENLGTAISERWIQPLEAIVSLDGLQAFGRSRCLELQAGDAASALVSLAAESAPDSVLGASLEDIFRSWRDAVAAMIERGKVEGWIHRSIQPAVEAAFLVSAFSGFTVTTKCGPDESTRRTCATALEGYLETLRAQ